MIELTGTAATVLDLSKQLLALAEAGSWSEIAGTERRRTELMEQLFRLDIQSPEDSRFLAQTVETILAIDARIVKLVEKERDRNAGELRQLNLGQQGKRAYLTVSHD